MVIFNKKEDRSSQIDLLGNLNTKHYDLERQNLVRKYIEKVELEKIGDKRGHYKVTVIFKDNTTVTYKYWSSGPWNSISLCE